MIDKRCPINLTTQQDLTENCYQADKWYAFRFKTPQRARRNTQDLLMWSEVCTKREESGASSEDPQPQQLEVGVLDLFVKFVLSVTSVQVTIF